MTRARCNRCTMTFRVEEPESFGGGEEHGCPECGLEFKSRNAHRASVIVSVTPAEAEQFALTDGLKDERRLVAP